MQKNNIDKTLAVYKGDIIAGMLFSCIGVLFLISSAILFYWTSRIGYYYLSVGLALFALYGLGKGISIMYVAKNRLDYYRKLPLLDEKTKTEEIFYTEYRLKKKEKSRRSYAWVFGLTIIIAIIGIFLNEKGLVVGTAIPVILFAAIEFVYGLLTEFRLWEYKRTLEK